MSTIDKGCPGFRMMIMMTVMRMVEFLFLDLAI